MLNMKIGGNNKKEEERKRQWDSWIERVKEGGVAKFLLIEQKTNIEIKLLQNVRK